MKLPRPGSSTTQAASSPSRDSEAKELDAGAARLDIQSAIKSAGESGRATEPARREMQAIRLDAFRQRFHALNQS